ncbi:olfactory receptor 8H1-like [Fukomys damarensis]|uniref:olfactory receptor 8H1-like n=1 Tax=Fukomys damarensis TaxID=885580 RepID=UPI001455C6CE|nr:olfactory receptor 8H1-like [Fukomys damarensis]
MSRRNSTSVPDFILMGLMNSAKRQLVLSVVFLLIYLITVLGNAVMILIIRLDPQLHTPMYFFLTHLSFLDLSYSSVITPKTLQNLLTSTKSISFLDCFTQLFFFIVFGVAECFLLSSMAYDRYVAICSPLHYPVIMSTRLCWSLLVGSYVISFVDSTVNVVCISRLNFCNSNVIQHFFCDTSPILALSCSDTFKSLWVPPLTPRLAGTLTLPFLQLLMAHLFPNRMIDFVKLLSVPGNLRNQAKKSSLEISPEDEQRLQCPECTVYEADWEERHTLLCLHSQLLIRLFSEETSGRLFHLIKIYTEFQG